MIRHLQSRAELFRVLCPWQLQPAVPEPTFIFSCHPCLSCHGCDSVMERVRAGVGWPGVLQHCVGSSPSVLAVGWGGTWPGGRSSLACCLTSVSLLCVELMTPTWSGHSHDAKVQETFTILRPLAWES